MKFCKQPLARHLQHHLGQVHAASVTEVIAEKAAHQLARRATDVENVGASIGSVPADFGNRDLCPLSGSGEAQKFLILVIGHAFPQRGVFVPEPPGAFFVLLIHC